MVSRLADRTRSQNFILILSLGFLNALTPFSIDMYLPSFPEIARDLNVSISQVTLSVSTYFIGFALGQIFYGPFLDRFGRKPPIFFGLSLYILSTFGCLTAHSLTQLLLFRFLSALGGSAASVGATSMVRDYFPAEMSARIFSYLMLVLSASPLLAPTFGSWVVAAVGWRMIFAILAGFGLVNLLLVAFVLPYVYEPDESLKLRLKPIAKGFWSILKNRQFFTYVLAGSFSFAGLFVFVGSSPAIFMDGYHVSAKAYGGIFALLAGGMIGGGQLNLWLARRFDDRTIFRVALWAEGVFASAFLLASLLTDLDLTTTIGFLFLVLLGSGITYPNAVALGLAPFSKNVGSASSLLGFLQLGVGALASAGTGLVNAKAGLATAAVMCFSTIIALLILLLTAPRRVVKPSHETPLTHV